MPAMAKVAPLAATAPPRVTVVVTGALRLMPPPMVAVTEKRLGLPPALVPRICSPGVTARPWGADTGEPKGFCGVVMVQPAGTGARVPLPAESLTAAMASPAGVPRLASAATDWEK